VNNAVFNIRWKSLTLRDRSWTRACIPGRRAPTEKSGPATECASSAEWHSQVMSIGGA